jgi:hypothetical protein
VNWTTEFPTKPGFYWVKNLMLDLGPGFIDSTPRPGRFIVKVSRQGATVEFTGDDDIYERKDFISAEWQGPIEPDDVGREREHWLNGWHRRGDSVLIGTGVRCAGCGKFLGLACVAFDGSLLPEKNPDFPFEEATCPLCACRRSPGPVDKLTERLERLREKSSPAITALRQIYQHLDILWDWPGDDSNIIKIINKLDWHIESQELQRYNDAVEEEERREMYELDN